MVNIGMQLNILTSDQIQAIHTASLQVLEKVGVIINNDSALKLLADAGASVDFSERRARMPSHLIEEGIRKAPNNFRLFGRTSKYDVELKNGKTYAHNIGGCTQIFDIETRRAREATEKDLEKSVRLIDALDNLHCCRPFVYPSEFPIETRDIHTMEGMLRITEKPCGVTAYNSMNLDYIIKLVSAMVGGDEELRKRPIIYGGCSPDSPLKYSNEAVNMLVKYVMHGVPTHIAPCPLAGGTSPVTLAGTLVQQNAEVLSGILIAQLVKPGSPIKYTSRPLPMDMTAGVPLFGAIEFGIMSTAIVQLAKYYGIPSDVYGLGTSSKTLDEQAAFEKALNAILPALAGANFISGAGSLEAGVTSSLEQLTIDNEILGMIFRVIQGISIDDEMLAVDIIAKVGPGGHFLKEPHTRKYFRKEHFIPRLCDRNSRTFWEKAGAKNIADVAKETTLRILAEHQVASLDNDVLQELNSILKEADKKLIKT